MSAGSSNRYFQKNYKDKSKFVPEGVEGRVEYKGNVSKIIYQLKGGLRSSMGYIGAKKLEDRAQMIRSAKEFADKISHIKTQEVNERDQNKSQEDLYNEESIYSKFTSAEDNKIMPEFHRAEWEKKLHVISKFNDERLKYFGKKLAPPTKNHPGRKPLEISSLTRLAREKQLRLTLNSENKYEKFTEETGKLFFVIVYLLVDIKSMRRSLNSLAGSCPSRFSARTIEATSTIRAMSRPGRT